MENFGFKTHPGVNNNQSHYGTRRWDTQATNNIQSIRKSATGNRGWAEIKKKKVKREILHRVQAVAMKSLITRQQS